MTGYDAGTAIGSLIRSSNPRSYHVHYLIGIVVFVGLTAGAIALGVKFFDTSVSEQEHDKKW